MPVENFVFSVDFLLTTTHFSVDYAFFKAQNVRLITSIAKHKMYVAYIVIRIRINSR